MKDLEADRPCALEALVGREAIRAGRVFVDGRRVRKPSFRLAPGARVRVHDPSRSSSAEPEVLFEDEDLLVLDKPAGVAVNVSETSPRFALAERFAQRAPFVVHRLDLGTTGVLLLAKRRSAAAALSEAFAAREVDKRYVAVVEGVGLTAVLDDPIGKDRRRPRARSVHRSGQAAETATRALGAGEGFAVVEARPRTGRTHQIRVHLAHAGQPLLGDTLYGGPAAVRLSGEVVRIERPLLHALELVLPASLGGRRFRAPVPSDLVLFLDAAGAVID